MPLPGVSSTIRDGGLNVTRPENPTTKSVLVVGTARSGPMNDPVPISSLDQLENLFGPEGYGNLVRAVKEVWYTMEDNLQKDVRAMRVGDGETAVLTFGEYTGMIDEEAPYGPSGLNIALKLESRFPDEELNNLWVSYKEDIEDFPAIEIYNPKTGLKSVYTYDINSDADVDVSNVRELAETINNDNNLAPWIEATYFDIEADFECWIGSGIAGHPKYNFGFSYASSAQSSFDLQERFIEDPSHEGFSEGRYGEAGPFDGSEDLVLAKSFLEQEDPMNARESAANNVNRILDVYSITSVGVTEIDSKNKNIVELDYVPLNTFGEKCNTFSAFQDYNDDGLYFGKPNATWAAGDIGTYASEYLFHYEKEMLTPGMGVSENNDGRISFNSFLPIDVTNSDFNGKYTIREDPDGNLYPYSEMADESVDSNIYREISGGSTTWNGHFPGALSYNWTGGTGVTVSDVEDSTSYTDRGQQFKLEYSFDGTSWKDLSLTLYGDDLIITFHNNGQGYPGANTSLNVIDIDFPQLVSHDYYHNGDGVIDDFIASSACPVASWSDLTEEITHDGSTYTAIKSEYIVETLEWLRDNDKISPIFTLDATGSHFIFREGLRIRMSADTMKGQMTQVYNRHSLVERADYYFVKGPKVIFGDVLPEDIKVNYTSKVTFHANTDYIFNEDGLITFINPDKQPYGESYESGKRFIIGFNYTYQPEWIDLSIAKRSLHGGESGYRVGVRELEEAYDEAFKYLQDYAVDIVVPKGIYFDQTKIGYNSITGAREFHMNEFTRNFADFLDEVSSETNETVGVMSIEPPDSYSLPDLKSWVDQATKVSTSDPNRAANVMAALDCRWLLSTAGEFSFMRGDGTYITDMSNIIAGVIASKDPSRSLVHFTLPDNLGLPAGRKLSKRQKERMVNGKFIIPGYSSRSGLYIVDEPTAAEDGSDFSHYHIVETVIEAMDLVRDVAEPFIGKVNNQQNINALSTAIDNGLNAMVPSLLQTFNKQIVNQDPARRVLGIVDVNLVLIPQFTIREIRTTVKLRPS